MHLSAIAVGTLTLLALISCRFPYQHFAGFEDIKTDSQSNSIFTGEYCEENLRRQFQWRQDPWESIDNQQIFMNGVTIRGDLNARQSCAAESTAKHNLNRVVKIYLSISCDYEESYPENTMLKKILQQYNNINVIFLNETLYFKKTVLENWYNERIWEKSPHKCVHLSEFLRLVSLFKGGGLFIDIDTVVTLRPLNKLKLWNFFVKSSATHELIDSSHITSSEIFHLVYGHPLSDDLILNMGRATYNPFAPAYHHIDIAIKESIENRCLKIQTKKTKNYCKYIKLFDRQDIFLPQFGSAIWHPLISAMKQNVTQRKNKKIDKAIKSIINNIFDTDRTAPLMTWKFLGPKHFKRTFYEILHAVVLPKHCPVTVKHFSKLESWFD